MKIKRVFILKSADSTEASLRLERLRAFISDGKMPESVSVRAYTSQEDDTLIVESWMFDSLDHEQKSLPALAEILDEMRPAVSPGQDPASYANELGLLGDRNTAYWND